MSKTPDTWAPFGGKRDDEDRAKRWKDHEERVEKGSFNPGKKNPNPAGTREDERAKKRRRGFR